MLFIQNYSNLILYLVFVHFKSFYFTNIDYFDLLIFFCQIVSMGFIIDIYIWNHTIFNPLIYLILYLEIFAITLLYFFINSYFKELLSGHSYFYFFCYRGSSFIKSCINIFLRIFNKIIPFDQNAIALIPILSYNERSYFDEKYKSGCKADWRQHTDTSILWWNRAAETK